MKIINLKYILLAYLMVGIVVAAHSQNAKPNILFIAFDDLRPQTGAYGVPEAITPNLDAFAADACRFERAYVNYPLCLPSRASMLTGLRFDNARQPDGKKANFADLVNTQATWPQVFREAGYWTATRGKLYHGNVPRAQEAAWHIPGPFWSDRKHKDWNEDILSRIHEKGGREDQLQAYLEKGQGSGSLIYVSVDGPDELLEDGKTANDVVDYLKNKRDKSKPFLISAGFSRPHMPWVAPKKYFDRYPEEVGRLAYLPEGEPQEIPKIDKTSKNQQLWNEGVDDETARKLIWGYMAATTFADAQMGKIIQALKEEGVYENTIIVVWGDHGYHLTDHGLWRKNTPYHVALRSPLMIRYPGMPGAKVANQIVQNIDIYPTLLELTGVAKPKALTLHGESLVPILQDPQTDWKNITYTCARDHYGLITDQYRFTEAKDGSLYLYDLEKDPHEWNNLAYKDAYQTQVKKFLNQLEKVTWNQP